MIRDRCGGHSEYFLLLRIVALLPGRYGPPKGAPKYII